MKVTKQEIKDYIYQLFMVFDLDWNDYMALKRLEKQCLDKGEIIFLQ